MLNGSQQQQQQYGSYGSITVERPYYEQEQLNHELSYAKPKRTMSEYLHTKWKNFEGKQCCLGIIPVIGWLSQYNLKNDFVGDIISGCTVAIMHIPQGMGYAMLANVPPVVGIYTAFFPVLVYFFLGTSRHNSMGTFAVICIMTSKPILQLSDINMDPIGDVGDGPIPIRYSAIQVAAALCFLVGLMQVAMYVFRLGIVSSLLSETLVSGFTTGAAIHVMTSQVKDLFGVKLRTIDGNFQVVMTYYEIIKQLTWGNFNWAAIIISVISIVILVFNNEILKPIVSKRCSIPIPIELIAVVAGALFGRYLNLEEVYGTVPVGDIPTGLPGFEMPPLALLSDLALDAFTISMVSYTVSVSMALIFAQKLSYEIDFNQELLAMGVGNIFGSFFSCIPQSASLSRSTIQQTVGGKTQLASLICCGLLAIVLLWVGPFFEPLPKAVLASVIVVALKGMLWQVKEFIQFWKLSRLDAFVWMATFLTVVLVAIDIGLAVGIILSLTCIFIRGMKPYSCLLGQVPKTDLYLDINRYKGAEEIPSIKIFHYCGSLNFASRSFFKSELCSMLNLDIPKEIKRKAKMGSDLALKKYDPIQFKTLIIDFSALSYIDPSSVTSMKLLINDFKKLAINVYIAGSSCPAYEIMKKCGLNESADGSFKFFPTVHDAVHHTMGIMMPISVITNNNS